MYYIRKKPHAIRIDPLETDDEFIIRHFRLVRVARLFAVNRMLRKLARNHRLFTGQSLPRIRRNLKALPGNQARSFTVLYDTYCTLLANKDSPTDYPGWIETVEKPGLPDAATVESTIASFTHTPSISISLQVRHFTPALLNRCIRSFFASPTRTGNSASRAMPRQVWLYGNPVQAFSRDPRIHVVICPIRSFRVIELRYRAVYGKYIARLGYADELAEHALLYVAQGINDNPDAKILYSDDDCIDATGLRHNPHMKPCWNPDLFLRTTISQDSRSSTPDWCVTPAGCAATWKATRTMTC